MELLKWVGASVLLLFCLVLSVSNWWIGTARARGSVRTSWIPLLGGLAGTIGLLLVPIQGARDFWWVPMLLDFGCVPGLVYAAFSALAGRSASK